MRIDITARNISISQDLSDFIHEKLLKLIKYDNTIVSSKIVLLKESRAEKVELIVTSKDRTYISKCYSSVFEKTIIKATDNILKQIRRTKP